MFNTTRLSGLAVTAAALLAFGFTPTSADAAEAPDVRATSLGAWCDAYDGAYYDFRLTNRTDSRRYVTGAIAWRGQGYKETFNLGIAPGSSRLLTERVHETMRAEITLRSEGKVILRAEMDGAACSKPS
jgi:hypothetical protein